MLKRLSIALVVLLAIGVGAPSVPVLNVYVGPIIGVEAAKAQQKKKRKTLFDVLFKRRKKKKTPVRVTKPKATVRTVKRKNTQKRKTTVRRASTAAAAAAAPVVIAVKNENASKILVVGDFLAGGMARELDRLYASNPNIVVINKSNPSSGLVRDDVINWPEQLPILINEYKPIAVVNLVGMNDRQKLWSVPGKPDKLSAEWLTEYNKRVTTITTATATNQVPLVWVGLPPVRSSSMNADYLVFNETYRTKIEASIGGVYVDIWDGFTNEEGKFVSAGPDINGQIVRLRGKKGINMTRAGRAKLAFFADKALNRLGIIDNAADFKFASLGTVNLNSAQPNAPLYDPAGTGRTNIIALGSPSLDGGNVLEGGELPNTNNDEDTKSISYDLVQKGRVFSPKAGRIDSAWGLPATPEKKQDDEKADSKKTSSLETAKPLSSAQKLVSNEATASN